MDIEALEHLALAEDRSLALAALLPGTVEHDYWRGIFLQHAGRLAEVDEILSGWTKRHGSGHDEQRERLGRHQLLLRADADLAATADELQREASVVLDDRAEVVVQAHRYPTRLDPALIDGNKLLRAEIHRRSDLATVSDWGLPEVIGLLPAGDVTRRRSLLQRLVRSNIAGLVDLIAADLDDQSSGGFGSIGIHSQLTLDQLEELAAKRPELRSRVAWVDAVLVRLRPPSWVDLRADRGERGAFFDRLWTFVAGLAEVFNSLKAQVLYRRLELDRAAGVFDRTRFLAYLELPRNAHYVSRDWLARVPREHLVQPASFAARAAGLEPIGDDEPLVRDYLARFLLEEDGSAFTHRLHAEWIQEQLAITRLLAGAAVDAERWATVLGPSRLAALRDRVDIDLAPQNPSAFRANDDVAIEVDVKNVRALEVKVFRINTLSYFLAKGAEVDTSLDLDGMIASGDELDLTFDTPPLRRVRTRIALPACKRPGTYIVELIGNGRSSRALVRKGALQHAVRVGAAGLVVTIMNQNGVPLPDACLWLGGREMRPREGGDDAAAITIPFSTRPGATPVLLVHGDVTQRVMVEHPAEVVRLHAGLHLERESLVPNQLARVLCRPTLTIANAEASLAILEDARVDISVTDLAGTSSSRTQPLVLRDDGEAVIEINIPDGITHIALALRGRVRVVSTQQTVDVEDGAESDVNVIHTTEETASLHLVKSEGHYELQMLGKTGETLAGRAVSLRLRHRVVSAPVDTTLETNDRGAIELGPLAGIDWFAATLPSGTPRSWSPTSTPDVPRTLHVQERDPILVPIPAGTHVQDLSLMELRGGAPANDLTAQISLTDGCAAFNLATGEYRLSGRGLPADVAIAVTPRAGASTRPGWAVAGQAMMELTPPLPLIRSFAREGAELVLRLSGARAQTRVHLIATRFYKDPVLPSSLYQRPRSPLSMRGATVLSQYISGRDIGDEYRYVLERRSAPRRPGTMLEKPSLLLNPWALRSTSTGVQVAAAGAAYGAARSMAPPAPAMAAQMQRPGAVAKPAASEQPGFPSVDFLARGAIVIDNLRPDADGVVRVPLAELGAAQLVQAIVVDPLLTSVAELALAPVTTAPRDLRLRLALDPTHHYAEDRSVAPAPSGTPIVIPDVRTGKIELIDTVARAHQLLVTLTGDSDLRELAFVTEWPSLDDATRRAKYGKYACHELHLFLWRKDPSFFETAVRPYLAHKRDKTFVDRFLIGEDLSSYLEPWAFGQLNTVERILLGSRISDVREAIARLLGDAVDVLPQDPERDARLVATLLGASALESGGGRLAASAGARVFDGDLLEVTAARGRAAAEGEDSDVSAMMSMPRTRSASAAPAPPGGGGGYRDSLKADAGERGRAEPLYRGADKTQEWAETNWWKRRVSESGSSLIVPNRLWRDLARHTQARSEAPFLSPHLGDCASSFAEAMCALAFLDLPFVAAAHETKVEDMSLTVTPRSHALVARTRIVEIPVVPEKGVGVSGGASVLIGQSYFRSDDRWEWDGAERREKYVTGEMIVGVVYRCQVVVTNPTSRELKLDVLLQVPRGAIPVASGFVTRTMSLRLSPHGTESREYGFYFPRPGRFTHFPAHVTKGLTLQVAAEARELEVVSETTTADLGSWSHVSQHGSLEDVLAFLDRANLNRIDLRRIAWRMHERMAFEQVTARLVSRHVYDDGLWRYAFAHRDPRRLREWLRHQDELLRPVQQDAIERGWYEHLEYAPLINARAHQLGARRRILNDALAEQYRSFLDRVAHRARVAAGDLLGAAHYLLCLDRVDDALAVLGRISSPHDDVASRLQHDYLAAYCACYRGDLALARRLASPWADHPVDRWRHRFFALITMLDEVELGSRTGTPAIDPDNRDQRMAESAARQPALDLSASGAEIVLQHHNLTSCQLRFFRMDIELVFSRQPFVQGDIERFSFIEPGHVQQVPLAVSSGGGRTVVPIPPQLRGANLVIEAVATGLRKSVAHYAHDLGIQIAQAYGQIRVVQASTQAPLPATYVKVYGRRRDGQASFFKDGYTDLRGSFDYATLSTDDLERVERFALLVVSDDAGATIVEASPPAQ